jgi:hypothetical protein
MPSRGAIFLAVLTVFMLAGVFSASSAFAGRSSTGEQAFYPQPPLPNGFQKHTITLEVHDTLGKGDEACLACHDDPSRNPGMLLAPDRSLIDIKGDVSRVCQTCHFEKYTEWKQGVHGNNMPKCSAAGCHDPHTPSWIYVAALPPFIGTGTEVRAVSEREAFTPLAGVPVAPPVSTPTSLVVVALIGAVMAAGALSLLIPGRAKR